MEELLGLEALRFDIIAQQLFYGILMGAMYVLMASGFSLIWGIMNMLNFAHGEFFMLGGYFTFYLFSFFHLNPVVAVFISMVLVGVLGVALFNFVIFPINKKPNWLTNTIIITLGISICAQNLALVIFGERYKAIPRFIDYTLSFGGVNIGGDRLVILFLALCMILGLWVFIQKTNIGVSMQAVAQNREAADIMGLPIRSIYLVTIAVSSALAAATGGLLAPIYSIYPTVGFMPMLMAFLVVILGGLGSVKGAIVAGFLLGILESLAILYLTATWKDVVIFTIIILILSFKPRGLFGTRHS